MAIQCIQCGSKQLENITNSCGHGFEQCQDCKNIQRYDMENDYCELCEGNGYVFVYNTQNKTDEIQRCDECAIFESDEEAKEAAASCKHSFIDTDNEGFYGKEMCRFCGKEQNK